MLFAALFGALWLVLPGKAAPDPDTASITKSHTTSINNPAVFNNQYQAVAGERITITVNFQVNQSKLIYNAIPRVLLQDGIFVTGTSADHTVTTNQSALDSARVSNRRYTQVQFTQLPVVDATAAPVTLTYHIYAIARQQNFLPGGSGDIGNTTQLLIQPILRWCLSDGCTVDETLAGPYVTNTTDSNTASVVMMLPDLTINIVQTPTYLDASGLGAGGGQVRMTINLANGGQRPPAYDVVVNATASSNLAGTNMTITGASSGGVVTPSGVTWNLPGPFLASVTTPLYITATLPSTFQIGTEFRLNANDRYETYPGTREYEGVYTKTAGQLAMRPGVLVTKSSVPASGNITMADSIAYTVVMRQAPNTSLVSPSLVDTLPLGMHLVPGTFTITGATPVMTSTTEGPNNGASPLRYYSNLNWTLASYTTGGTQRIVTVGYTALNTGLDYRNAYVWDSANDMTNTRNTVDGNKTGVVLSWTAPAGSAFTSFPRANPTNVSIIQPYMGANFSSVRTDMGVREVGSNVNLATRFRNTGQLANAYELEVCDTLPYGLKLTQNNGCFDSVTGIACPFSYSPPPINSTGKVCWTIPNFPKYNNTQEFRYQVTVEPEVFPGVHTNAASISTYSTKPGSVYGERVYGPQIPASLPPVANCGASCITVLGLNANIFTQQSTVSPGGYITYTLAYTDTSIAFDYTGFTITDTYDPRLTFISASPAPSSHNATTRTLNWNLGSVPANGSGQIVMTMRLAPVINDQYEITNTMVFDSNQTIPHQRVKVTPIQVADLHLRLLSPEFTSAGEALTITAVYSNTGSANMPVDITVAYSPYVDFVSAAPAPTSGNNVFSLVVPNDGVDRMVVINLRVKAPLPVDLTQITGSAEISSQGAPPAFANVSVPLKRPVLDFKVKTDQTVAPAVNAYYPYQFTLTNVGDLAATNVVITFTWDTGTSYFSGVGWTANASNATFTIPTLDPGASASISDIVVRVNTLKPYYESTGRISSTQTVLQQVTHRLWGQSLALDIKPDADPAFPGRSLTYTVYYTNTGPTFQNALVVQTLPAGFSFTGQSFADGTGCATGWSFTKAGSEARWSCTTINTNATGRFTITGSVTAAEGTWLETIAQSSGTDIPVRVMDAPVRTRVARPWLRVSKTSAPTYPVAPGSIIQYTLTYENYGTDAAYSVVVKDQLPSQVTFQSCSNSCTQASGLVTWNLGTVPAGSTQSVTVNVKVKTGTHGATISNSQYTIQSSLLTTAETQTGAAATNTVLDPKLELEKSANKTTFNAPNEVIEYTFTYTNNGGSGLSGIVLTDALSIATSYQSGDASCTHTGELVGGTVTCSLGSLAQGESRSFKISVVVASTMEAGDIILNTSQATSVEAPAVTSNTTVVCYQACGIPSVSAPSSITIKVPEGGADTAPLVISNSGTMVLVWTLDENASWLTLSATSGLVSINSSQTVTLNADASGLAPGTYTTTLTLRSNAPSPDNVKTIQVTFIVGQNNLYLPLTVKQ